MQRCHSKVAKIMRTRIPAKESFYWSRLLGSSCLVKPILPIRYASVDLRVQLIKHSNGAVLTPDSARGYRQFSSAPGTEVNDDASASAISHRNLIFRKLLAVYDDVVLIFDIELHCGATVFSRGIHGSMVLPGFADLIHFPFFGSRTPMCCPLPL